MASPCPPPAAPFILRAWRAPARQGRRARPAARPAAVRRRGVPRCCCQVDPRYRDFPTLLYLVPAVVLGVVGWWRADTTRNGSPWRWSSSSAWSRAGQGRASPRTVAWLLTGSRWPCPMLLVRSPPARTAPVGRRPRPGRNFLQLQNPATPVNTPRPAGPRLARHKTCRDGLAQPMRWSRGKLCLKDALEQAGQRGRIGDRAIACGTPASSTPWLARARECGERQSTERTGDAII